MRTLAMLVVPLTLAIGITRAMAQAGTPSPAAPMAEMHHHPAVGMPPGAGQSAGVPVEPGQAAFGALQEIVRMLQADPTTDWTKVDIDALRQHLIDMDELTLRANARKEPIANGLRIVVTGNGRTRAAIQRMIPEHAKDINGLYGWTVRATTTPDGAELTVTSTNAADTPKIRGLGFMGIMVLGTHQAHHLMMATGGMAHTQAH